jgi:hypothetical protein
MKIPRLNMRQRRSGKGLSNFIAFYFIRAAINNWLILNDNYPCRITKRRIHSSKIHAFALQ